MARVPSTGKVPGADPDVHASAPRAASRIQARRWSSSREHPATRCQSTRRVSTGHSAEASSSNENASMSPLLRRRFSVSASGGTPAAASAPGSRARRSGSLATAWRVASRVRGSSSRRPSTPGSSRRSAGTSASPTRSPIRADSRLFSSVAVRPAPRHASMNSRVSSALEEVTSQLRMRAASACWSTWMSVAAVFRGPHPPRFSAG